MHRVISLFVSTQPWQRNICVTGLLDDPLGHLQPVLDLDPFRPRTAALGAACLHENQSRRVPVANCAPPAALLQPSSGSGQPVGARNRAPARRCCSSSCRLAGLVAQRPTCWHSDWSAAQRAAAPSSLDAEVQAGCMARRSTSVQQLLRVGPLNLDPGSCAGEQSGAQGAVGCQMHMGPRVPTNHNQSSQTTKQPNRSAELEDGREARPRGRKLSCPFLPAYMHDLIC